MDAWWPKLLHAEFDPMLGPARSTRSRTMTGFGGTDFADGWFGYASKDLRRLFALGHERGRYSRVYCGNLPGRPSRPSGCAPAAAPRCGARCAGDVSHPAAALRLELPEGPRAGLR